MIAYLDLPSGLSGDMFLGCLVDAGWSIDDLRAALTGLKLGPEAYSISCQSVMKGPLRATCVTVQAVRTMHQRRLCDIRNILDASSLPVPVKAGALAIFQRLAEAEAKVHGTSVDEIHFHEVGAVDALVDIVGAAAGIHALGIDRLYASPVPLGEGWVQADHGRLPIPAPATLELLTRANAPVRPSPGPGELTTPTGAAIISSLATFVQPRMNLHRIGTGAGQKNFAWPNVARLWLGQPTAGGAIVQIETNIDDMNPQLYSTVVDHLFAAGALDVWLTPVQMKKGRPGTVLSVLASSDSESVLVDIVLRHTTTLGVRVHHVLRHEAARQMRSVPTPWGPVQVKLKLLEDKIIGATPEFDDCKRLAEQQQLPLHQVIEAARSAAGVATPAELPK